MIPLSFVNVATNIKFLEQSPSTRHFTGNDVPIFYLFIEELTPRIVGEAFYNGELENELRRIGKIDYLFKRDSDRERCMRLLKKSIVQVCMHIWIWIVQMIARREVSLHRVSWVYFRLCASVTQFKVW